MQRHQVCTNNGNNCTYIFSLRKLEKFLRIIVITPPYLKFCSGGFVFSYTSSILCFYFFRCAISVRKMDERYPRQQQGLVCSAIRMDVK